MQEKYLAEVESHFNELCVGMYCVARVIGYREDDEDCYWILREGGSGKKVYHSMVISPYFITGADDYDRINDSQSMNGNPEESEFIVEIDTGSSVSDAFERAYKANEDAWKRLADE